MKNFAFKYFINVSYLLFFSFIAAHVFALSPLTELNAKFKIPEVIELKKNKNDPISKILFSKKIKNNRVYFQDGIWAHHVSSLFSSNINPHLDQGWKIHISATKKNAVQILKKVLPVIKDFRHKVIQDLQKLAIINSGSFSKIYHEDNNFIQIEHPKEQVGKFIVIYIDDNGDNELMKKHFLI